MESRVRFRDLKPYCAPESLEALRGPTTVASICRTRCAGRPTAAERTSTTRAGAAWPTRRCWPRGAPPIQERLLNRRRLVEMWPLLNLDRRVLDLWEGRFPELRVPYADGQRNIARVAIELDLGVDWRAQDPVMLDIGPVLSPDDAVGNETAACSPAARPATTSTWTASAARAGTRTNASSNSPNARTPASTGSGSHTGSWPSTAFNSARSSRTT